MANNELDATVIKLTQETLGKYVKKPALTEKLLKKPPFRFLHDVFNAVIRETGYFVGLYTAEELKYENIKDRNDKMRFLQKMIDVIKITAQKNITVRTSKIVAGYEPEKTNEMLQLMGTIIEQQLNWQSAVNQVLGVGSSELKTNAKLKENKDHEKIKEKTNETNVKETKIRSKSITPTTNEEKSRKREERIRKKGVSLTPNIEKAKSRAESKEKTKTAISKSESDTKDKPVKKSKINAEEPKHKSPTLPINMDNKVIKSESPKKIEEMNMVSTVRKKEEKEKKQSPSQERRNSKSADLLAHSMVALLNETNANMDSNSRVSSAQRKVSAELSTKDRLSSGQNSKVTENNEQEPQIPYNLDDFKQAFNEIDNIPKEVVQTTIVPQQKSILISRGETTGGKIGIGDMKREITFTRENSKDSNSSSTHRPRTSLRPPSARPPSARPGAPRRRDKNVEIVLQSNEQIKMSGINVKLETFGDFDDDGENLVIIEDSHAHNITGNSGGKDQQNQIQLEAAEMAQQGHLVQQILETQKELVQQNVDDNGAAKDDNLIGVNGTRQSSARQMNSLRDVIQTLTKSVNPFGKLMDFIPEDIDAMQLELTMWRDTFMQASHELKRERSLTKSAMEPMKQQLIQIEANIKEYLEMIDASRSKILQNHEKISSMLMEN